MFRNNMSKQLESFSNEINESSNKYDMDVVDILAREDL